jgi:hypothetical protein
MFHFTFIDEASTENEKEIVKKQETALKGRKAVRRKQGHPA